MHWARTAEAGFLTGMRFLHAVYRCGGRGVFRFFLFFVIGWFFLTHPLARRASREYLTRLYEHSGGKTPFPDKRNSFRHFLCFGETVLDKLLATDIHHAVQIPYTAEGFEYFERLLEEKRGAIIITAHLGNLELCRRLAQERHIDIRLTILVHTRHAERFNRLLKALNPAQEVDLIQVDSVDVVTAMHLSERIAAGAFIVIAGDRIPVAPGNATLEHPFLGKTAHFPVGPYILGAALSCPVFMLFSAREPKGFFVTVRLLAEKITLSRRSREKGIQPYLAAYVDTLAEICVKHPLQWFNFFPFWQLPNPSRSDPS